MDGSVDFYRVWNDYKLGFGNLSGEFWLGNDKLIAALQASANNVMRVDLESFANETAYAKFSSFSIGDESTKYLLTVSGYSGTAGESPLKINSYSKSPQLTYFTPFLIVADYLQYNRVRHPVLVSLNIII